MKDISIACAIIMKNESIVLSRMLETIFPILDYYVFLDTGSSDQSVKIVKDFFDLKGIKGEIHTNLDCCEIIDGEKHFNYQKARNSVLKLAKDKADYLFWLDCDEKLLIKETFDLKKFKAELSKHDSAITITQFGASRYGRKNFFKTSKPFRWVGALHEVLVCDEADATYFCNDIETIVVDDNDYDPNKYVKHAQLLQKEVDERGDARDTFYLAQSYRDCGNTEKAIEYYRKRALMTNGFYEERYISQYNIGNLYRGSGKPFAETYHEYMKCSELDSLRAEHYVNMIIDLQNNGLWNQAYILGKYCVDNFHKKNPYPNRVLFLSGGVYDNMLLEIHLRTLNRLGKSELAMAIKETVNLTLEDFLKTVPSVWKENREFVSWLLNRLNPKVTVELGVDYGYSLFCLAMGNKGIVYGIDSFKGDSCIGMRNAFDICKSNVGYLNKTHGIKNIEILKGNFKEIGKTWNKKIDILHLDGYPQYDFIKDDYETWVKHLSDSGVILFHNTKIYEGVKRLFNEINIPKFEFLNSNAGLGVASKDKSIIDAIVQEENRHNPKEKITIAYIDHDKEVFEKYLAPSLLNLVGDYDILYTDDKLNIAANYNKIIDLAKTRYILFVHQDVTFSPDFLNNIHRTINERKDFGALGVVGTDENRVNHWSEAGKIKEIPYLNSCCLLINKEHGIRFDEQTFNDFHLHVEDYCMQVSDKKLKCYSIMTTASQSSGASEYNIMGVYFKHHSSTGNKLGYSWGKYNECLERFKKKWNKWKEKNVTEIDVCILSYAKTEDLKKATEKGIETLLASENKSIKFNVIVVESMLGISYNNSVTIHIEEPFNYNRFLNIARKSCLSPYVVLANNDLIYEVGWASEIIKAMDNDSSILSASPYCPQTQTRVQYPLDIYKGTAIRQELAGWCIFQRRKIYDIIGDLDESVSFWFSDCIYANQLEYNGIVHALVTKSVVNHHQHNLGISGSSMSQEEQYKLTNGQSENYKIAKQKYEHKTTN